MLVGIIGVAITQFVSILSDWVSTRDIFNDLSVCLSRRGRESNKSKTTQFYGVELLSLLYEGDSRIKSELNTTLPRCVEARFLEEPNSLAYRS